jgi:hypothetical protein
MLFAAPSFAQEVTPLQCQPMTGASIGIGAYGDEFGAADNGDGAPDLAASVELPIVDPWGTRLELGAVNWAFEHSGKLGVPPGRRTVRVTRLTISAIRSHPDDCGSPVRRYVGAGIGGYRFEVDGAGVMIRSGGHALMGMDVPVGERLVVTGNVALHAARPPAVLGTRMYLTLHLSVGAKLRF